MPEPPDKNCSTKKKQDWVLKCDIALGVEHLGGITGAYSLVNSDAFDIALDTVVQMLKSYLKYQAEDLQKRDNLVYCHLTLAHPYESLCDYLFNFSIASWPLIESDRRFAAWAKESNGKWENPTSMLLGACLALVANNTNPNADSAIHKKWWQFWK